MLKLGKRPYIPDGRDLKAKEVFAAPLPSPPPRFGFGAIRTDWQMLGNDQYGDCVWAGAAHEHMLLNQAAGRAVPFNDQCVLGDYSACTGFNPDDPNTDQGTDVRTALQYRHATGIADARGNRHKIGAYVALTAGDVDELLRGAWTFECVGIGIQFPNTAMDQFNNGQPWDVVPGAQIEGGHYIVVTGRRAPDDLGCLTWGKRQAFTRAFYTAYCDEAWAYVTVDELEHGTNRRGLDLTQLNTALGRA